MGLPSFSGRNRESPAKKGCLAPVQGSEQGRLGILLYRLAFFTMGL